MPVADDVDRGEAAYQYGVRDRQAVAAPRDRLGAQDDGEARPRQAGEPLRFPRTVLRARGQHVRGACPQMPLSPLRVPLAWVQLQPSPLAG